MDVSEEDKSKANMPANIDLSNTVFIPVVNMDVSAGFGSLTEEIESTKDFVFFGKDWIKKHISANVNNLVMFTVRGDSMDGGNSRIKNGSQIIVDTSVKEYINDGIYAIRIGKSISLTKHILKERGYEILPKDVTFRRYAYWFRDNNFDKWTLARDGEKALK